MYAGGRRRGSSGTSLDGVAWLLAVAVVLAVVAAVFVLPAALVGHLLGYTPSVSDLFKSGHSNDAWMDAHYPHVYWRFGVMDLGLITAGVVTFRRAATRARLENWMVVYECHDGTDRTGVDRYSTKNAATRAGSKIETVTVGDDQRTVGGYRVVRAPPAQPATRRPRP